ncbi:hypothetical protein EDB86DRAFT_3087068 [Lactarius hatsudake]|nr:hypothetical protein EDB86DRAFT_3087068 [Lactarius hatsudake]
MPLHGENFQCPPLDPVDSEEEYKVERILDSRCFGRSRKLQYLVKWKGYPDLENQWVNKDDVFADEAIVEYEWSSTLAKAYKSKSSDAKSPPSSHPGSFTQSTMSLPTSTSSPAVTPQLRGAFTHQELSAAVDNLVAIEDIDNPNTPATYWILGEDGQRLNATPYTQAEVDRLHAALRDTAPSPGPLPVRVEYWVKTGKDSKHPVMGGLEGDGREVEARAAGDGSDKENVPPGEEEVIRRDDAHQIQEQPERELKEWYPTEHPFILSTTDSDDPCETPYTLDMKNVRWNVTCCLSDARFAPYGYVHNWGDKFVHFPITDAQGVTTQALYVQVIMTADPIVLALAADSDKTFSKPLYVEPQVHEHGKPHYGELETHTLAAGHANQHCLDTAVNKLKDIRLKAELHRFCMLKRKAERIEQRLHALAQALGGIQGDVA